MCLVPEIINPEINQARGKPPVALWSPRSVGVGLSLVNLKPMDEANEIDFHY